MKALRSVQALGTRLDHRKLEGVTLAWKEIEIILSFLVHAVIALEQLVIMNTAKIVKKKDANAGLQHH